MSFAKFVNTFFAEHHRKTALSIVVKGEVAKETVNYGTKTRAYVPI